MLDKVKMTLRLSGNDFDSELNTLIASALKDLKIANVDNIKQTDPMIIRAVCVYCRLNFGEPSDYDRLKVAYNELKAQLGMNGEYTYYAE